MTRGTRGSGAKNKGIFENCIIKKANIVSNVDGFRVDLQKSPRIEYQESMFSDTIDVAIVIINSSNRVRGSSYSTLMYIRVWWMLPLCWSYSQRPEAFL